MSKNKTEDLFIDVTFRDEHFKPIRNSEGLLLNTLEFGPLTESELELQIKVLRDTIGFLLPNVKIYAKVIFYSNISQTWVTLKEVLIFKNQIEN